MIDEKRRNKRLELHVTVELESLRVGDVTTVRYTDVDVVDISRSGIGFVSSHELEIGTHYNTRVQIWTKEELKVVVEIVRKQEMEDGKTRYGAFFVGLTDADALKIDIYQIFNDREGKE